MASSCCGIRKPKLNPLDSYAFCNGSKQKATSLSYDVCVNTVVKKEMCYFCFDILRNYFSLGNGEPLKTPVTFPNDSYPLFVTWKIGRDRRLRGCIGTFSSTSLHSALREYAVSSAVRDSRFAPVSKDELALLHCSVSILTNFEDARHYRDWVVGLHGVRIEFLSERGQRRSATYLPEVPQEQNWSQVETIDSLLRKGGYRGGISEDTRLGARVVRYTSEKITVSYAEYANSKQSGCRV